MARRKKHYWLLKSEPEAYSIDDLASEGTTPWTGVRNYQARNLLRDDIATGDEVLFYRSREQPIGVAGTATITAGGYPDPLQFDPQSKYHDAKATQEVPRWFAVDVTFATKFAEVVPLAALKENPKLSEMMVVQRGSRLSVQPVTAAEFKAVLRMAAG